MKPSEAAAAALAVIETLKAELAAGNIPANAKSLADFDSAKYLAGVEDVAKVSRFVNVWLAAKK